MVSIVTATESGLLACVCLVVAVPPGWSLAVCAGSVVFSEGVDVLAGSVIGV